MKRCFVALLAFLLLLTSLTSCELFVPNQTTAPNYPIGNDKTDPAESLEDNYGFTVFPMGNYLADPKFDTDEFLPDYDADTSFIQFESTGGFDATMNGPTLFTTDDTVYYFDQNSLLIYYYDKATGITGPLCGKPECLHNDNTCNAYMPAMNEQFQYGGDEYINGLRVYGGKLYWSGGRAKLDGTDRETGLWKRNITGINRYLTTVIHRGYFYTAGAAEGVENGVPTCTAVVYATAMDGSESFTIMHKAMAAQNAYCTIRPVGNDLYIFVYSYTDGDPGGRYNVIEIYRWDSKTRQVESLYSGTEKEIGIRFFTQCLQVTPGDGIYLEGYRPSEETEDGTYYFYLCKYSFASGELEELAEFECKSDQYFNEPLCTNDYIIVRHTDADADRNNKHTLFLYDYDGNLVLTKSLGDHGFSGLLGNDDEYLYVWCVRVESWVQYYLMIPLDGGDVIVLNGEQ